MSSKRYSLEQIIKVLQEIDAGASIASVGRAHLIGVQTLNEWRKRYSGVGIGKKFGWSYIRKNARAPCYSA